MRRGHFVRFSKVRKNLVPRDILKWIPKNLKDSYDQTNIKGSKFFKGSNLAT